MKKTIRSKVKKYIWPSLLVILIVFAAVNAFTPDKEISLSEKRTLASFPKMTASALADGSFSSKFETWAADQLNGRDALVKIRTGMKLLSGDPLSNDVYKCSGGYLIERLYNSDETKLFNTAGALNALYDAAGLNIVLVCVPTAQEILPERLPAAAQVDDTASLMSGFYGCLNENITVCDLTGAIRSFSGSGSQAYYHSDHHWTTICAANCINDVFGALGIMNNTSWKPLDVCADFSGSLKAKSGFSAKTDVITVYKPETETAYIVTDESSREKKASVYSLEGLESHDPYTVFLGGNSGLLKIETEAADKGRLLVFKDSFFNCFLPFLIPEYSRIDVVDPRYYYDDIKMLLSSGGYTGILCFYNMHTLAEDTYLSAVLSDVSAREGEV